MQHILKKIYLSQKYYKCRGLKVQKVNDTHILLFA